MLEQLYQNSVIFATAFWDLLVMQLLSLQRLTSRKAQSASDNQRDGD